MIIGACGYGASGSSLVYDFLREFEGVQHLDFDSEFTYVYRVDGLQDLKYHLTERYQKTASGDAAIKRFLKVSNSAYIPFMKRQVPQKDFIKLTMGFVNKLVQGEFYGLENFDHENCSIIKSIIVLAFKKFFLDWYEKPTGKLYNIWPVRKMYICNNPNNFDKLSREYVMSLIKAMGFDTSKPILLNQPFEGNAPENSFPFFESPKAIIVDRDPRDIWISLETFYNESRFMPKHRLEEFIVQYKQTRCHQIRQNTDKKLHVQFEDFIYNYERVSKEIMEFLNLNKEKHINPKKYFNPSRSINNTQLVLKYPQFKDDCNRILAALPEYCFDYTPYGEIEHNGENF